MALKDDLQAETKRIFADFWTTTHGTVVPEPSSIQLGNHGVEIEGTVLYADLDGSTNLVDTEPAQLAAEVYKTYLHCAAKIIRAESGTITAYDGDRVMAVFMGSNKDNQAVRAGLKINYAVERIVNPAMVRIYTRTAYRVKQVVGIDTCSLLVARTGIRGSNDLVWVGHAANHAAKMAAQSPVYPTRISQAVYNNLSNAIKSPSGYNIWEEGSWDNKKIYKSNYEWVL